MKNNASSDFESAVDGLPSPPFTRINDSVA